MLKHWQVERVQVVVIHVKNGQEIQVEVLLVIVKDIQVNAKIDVKQHKDCVNKITQSFLHTINMLHVKKFLIFSPFILIIFILSCQDNNKYIKEFPSTINLSPKYISINEIIKIDNIYKYKDYIVLRDANVNADFFYYVYSLKDFSFLYKFCPQGNAPEEYLMPSIIKNTPNNEFSLRDHATDKYATFLLTDTNSVLIDKFTFSTNDNRFFWEINYIDKNKYLLKRSNSKISSRELWDFSSKIQLDVIKNTFDLSKEMGKDYYTEFDDYWISSYQNKVAFGYFFIDRIEIGTIRNNKINIEKYIGTEKHPNFYTFKKGRGKFKYNVDNNIVYYEYIVCTENNIYALYSGIPWGDLDKNHSSIIEIYNWQGEPAKKLNLEQSISAFAVNEKQGIIYGINPDINEDNILLYTYL